MPKPRNVYSGFIDVSGNYRMSLAERFERDCGLIPWEEETNECIPAFEPLNPWGYKAITLSQTALKFFNLPPVQLLHRLCWMIDRQQWIPSGKVIRHYECDNPRCQNPSHLKSGTDKDNVHDMHRRGRAGDLTGEKGPIARLTWDEVRQMRKYWATGNYTQKSLAEFYNVTQAQVYNIVHNKQWKE